MKYRTIHEEIDAACRRFPVEVILTHAADHLAAKMEEAAADVVANTAWV